MNSPVTVRYIGPHDAVEILDGQVEKIAVRGEPLEVSHDLARGVKGVPTDDDPDANVGALGGLLDQDSWELVKPPKADTAAPKEKL